MISTHSLLHGATDLCAPHAPAHPLVPLDHLAARLLAPSSALSVVLVVVLLLVLLCGVLVLCVRLLLALLALLAS